MTKPVRLPDAFLAWAAEQPDEGCATAGLGPTPEQQRNNQGATKEQHREAAVSALLEIRRAWSDATLSAAERDFLRAEELRLGDEICRMTSERLTVTATPAIPCSELPEDLEELACALSDLERCNGGTGLILDRDASRCHANGTWTLVLVPLLIDGSNHRLDKLEHVIAPLSRRAAA